MNREDAMLLQRWSEFLQAQGLSPRTAQQYRYAMLRLTSEANVAICDITEENIVRFLAGLGKRAASKQLYVRAFRSFYGWAHDRGEIATDPTAHVRPKAPPAVPPDAFTLEELEAIIRTAGGRDPRYAQAIVACYALGLRRSELCGLEPEDVDWQGRRVFIRCAKGDRPRWVEMNELARGALLALTATNGRRTITGWDPNWFTMIVNRAAREAGLPPNRRKAHMLRSSFATHLLGEGVPVSVVSRLLGHANIATTHRYAAVTPADRRAAVEHLPLLS